MQIDSYIRGPNSTTTQDRRAASVHIAGFGIAAAFLGQEVCDLQIAGNSQVLTNRDGKAGYCSGMAELSTTFSPLTFWPLTPDSSAEWWNWAVGSVFTTLSGQAAEAKFLGKRQREVRKGSKGGYAFEVAHLTLSERMETPFERYLYLRDIWKMTRSFMNEDHNWKAILHLADHLQVSGTLSNEHGQIDNILEPFFPDRNDRRLSAPSDLARKVDALDAVRSSMSLAA